MIVHIDGVGSDAAQLFLYDIFSLPPVGLNIVEGDPFLVESMRQRSIRNHPSIVPRSVEVFPFDNLLGSEFAELLNTFDGCLTAIDAQLHCVEVGIGGRENDDLLWIQSSFDKRPNAVVLEAGIVVLKTFPKQSNVLTMFNRSSASLGYSGETWEGFLGSW